MTTRRGVSLFGCLFSIVIAVAVVYFSINIGRIYWRYAEYEDDVRQEARFAGQRTNDMILGHLRASADSLGLPAEASKISIQRGEHAIAIEADYDEYLQLPKYVRAIHFHVHAEGTF